DEGRDDQDPVHVDGVGATHPHRRGVLARPPVGLQVAHVVDDEDRGGEEADGDREPEGQRRQFFGLHVEAAVDGDEAEEEEEDLAAAGGAVGGGGARREGDGGGGGRG